MSGLRTLDDGTVVAFMNTHGELTTEKEAAYAVLTYQDGSREVAVRSAGREAPAPTPRREKQP